MSNGSMMRATPLAVWAQNLSIEDLEKCVEEDTSLMHSSKDMWDLITAYCIAIKTLIKNTGKANRAELALEAVEEYANREGVSPLINEWKGIAEGIFEAVAENEQEG